MSYFLKVTNINVIIFRLGYSFPFFSKKDIPLPIYSEVKFIPPLMWCDLYVKEKHRGTASVSAK